MIVLLSNGCYSGWGMWALETTESKLRDGLKAFVEAMDKYTAEWDFKYYVDDDPITFLCENGYAKEADIPKIHVSDYAGDWSDQLKEFLK